MADHSSAAFVGLIIRQMAVAGIAAPTGMPPGGPPTVSVAVKRDLLAHACAVAGPGFILQIGQGIHAIPSDPTLDTLRRASDPADLLQRWTRLERYHHSHHRVLLRDSTGDSVLLEHVSLKPPAPTALETLAVFGLLAALFQAIGCRALDVDLIAADGSIVQAMQGSDIVLRQTDAWSGALWRLRWQSLAAEARIMPQALAEPGLVEQLYLLFDADPLRPWPLEAAAVQLRCSVRNLQRRLREAGASYSGILRDARVRRAVRAMLETGASLAEIGYAAGFADQAHFTRECRRILGASPAEWRRVATGVA